MQKSLLALVPILGLVVIAILAVGDRSDDSVERDPAPATDRPMETADLDLTGVGASRSALTADGPATWTVVVVDLEGRPVPDASLVATLGDERLEATGEAEWSDVTPGTWGLVVSDEEHRTTRTVELVAGAKIRTLVQLGMAAHVSGRVVNSRGELLRNHLVSFLRPGERPPMRASELKNFPGSRTGLDGLYSADLPEAGDWRPFVVFGGKVVYEASSNEPLAEGDSKRCDIVVPAETRLTIVLDDRSAPDPTVASAVSIYRRSTPQEIAHDEEIRARAAAIADSAPPEGPLDEEGQAELNEAMANENDPERLARFEQQKLWRTVVPDGWRSIKSSVVPEQNQIVFERIEYDTELRVALRRGGEVFRVDGSFTLGFASQSELTLSPPAPRDADAAPLDELRECPSQLRALEDARAPLRIGETWI